MFYLLSFRHNPIISHEIEVPATCILFSQNNVNIIVAGNQLGSVLVYKINNLNISAEMNAVKLQKILNDSNKNII